MTAPPAEDRNDSGSEGDKNDEAREFIGQKIHNVFIESLIAVGGMGVIYLGREEITERPVAVKVLRPERQTSDRDKEYFVREAQALSQIRHPNLVELYHVGTTHNNRNFMVLEYVPGRTLREVVEEDGALDPLRCVRLFRQLLLALEATHAHGILHRDLKPDNLLIEPLPRGKERLRLADLGLVKFTKQQMERLTDIGMTVGTPCYMSPEQVRGMELDARSDIYTTGVLMFEALTTYLPYPKARDVDELLDHILEANPAQLTRADPEFARLPTLQHVLDRMLAKGLQERPATAAEVIAIIDKILETELSGDIRAALKEHHARYGDDGSFKGALRSDVKVPNPRLGIPSRRVRPMPVKSGMIVIFRTTHGRSGKKAPPPPKLLRRLRAWLESGGEIVATERRADMVTYGLAETENTSRMAGGLPYLARRAAVDIPGISLCAGVAIGSFEIAPSGKIVEGETLSKALDYASRASEGQVLVCQETARRHGL